MKTIGATIDRLFDLREQKRKLEEQIKIINEEYREHEADLLELMDKQDTEVGRGQSASASISTVVRPSVEDWDAFYAYVHRHKYYHLLERRPSVSGCKELFDIKGSIPGVVPFTQRKLNLRRL